MSYQDILYVEQDGVATITINRPDVYNAFRAKRAKSCCKRCSRLAGTNRSA